MWCDLTQVAHNVRFIYAEAKAAGRLTAKLRHVSFASVAVT
jgi:hypothetical protein